MHYTADDIEGLGYVRVFGRIMSSFSRVTKNPLTGKFERADWIYHKFDHAYGVFFPSTQSWHRENEHRWEFDDAAPDAPLSGTAT